MATPSNILSRYKEVYAAKYTYYELSKLNPYISDTAEDILYHICLGNKSHDLPKMFGDIQVLFLTHARGPPTHTHTHTHSTLHRIYYRYLHYN